MKLAVLDLTTPFPGSEDKPGAGELIRDWLAPSLPDADWDIPHIALGADVPDVGAADGFVISGSEMGVYDTPVWMPVLRDLLLAAREAGKPLVGVCFGHQMMANTFGGKAQKSPEGVVVGAREFSMVGCLAPAHVWHQDQVVRVPPEARITGHAAYCPVGVLDYDYPAYSIQFHPEYRRGRLEEEIAMAVTHGFLSAAQAGDALASMAAHEVAEEIAAARAAAVLRQGG